MLKHESRMQPALGGKVCLMRVFCGIKVAEKVSCAFVSNLRDKFFTSHRHAHNASFAILARSFCVADILSIAGFPQVSNAVVVSDAVNVVDKPFRERPVDIKPRKAMGFVWPVVNVDVDVARLVLVPGNGACFGFAATERLPSKNARIGIVMQKLFQASLRQCNRWISHIIAPFQQWLGQRITVATNFGNPRNIIQGFV
jgi:hypothetical protein